jgi:hypothetical protein
LASHFVVDADIAALLYAERMALEKTV